MQSLATITRLILYFWHQYLAQYHVLKIISQFALLCIGCVLLLILSAILVAASLLFSISNAVMGRLVSLYLTILRGLQWTLRYVDIKYKSFVHRHKWVRNLRSYGRKKAIERLIVFFTFDTQTLKGAALKYLLQRWGRGLGCFLTGKGLKWSWAKKLEKLLIGV